MWRFSSERVGVGDERAGETPRSGERIDPTGNGMGWDGRGRVLWTKRSLRLRVVLKKGKGIFGKMGW